MASKKRLKKIANESGYNYERKNIRRKKNKVQLKNAERRPQKKG